MSNMNRKELIKEYCQGVKRAANEQVKKEKLITLLTQFFAEHDEFEIIKQFTSGAEKSLTEIKREGKKSERGRADTQYGSVIIEFEHDLKKTGSHAEDQLKDYLCGNWNSGLQINFTLIASDCLTWKVYAPDYESLIGLGKLQAEEIKLECVHKFEVNSKNADEFYYFLDRFLFFSQPLPATLQEVRNVFGHGSDIFQTAMQKMHEQYITLHNNSDMQTAYEQWHRFLSIAYGRFDASEQIFLTQSYLSILAKMLAYEIITGDDFIDDNEMKEILNGEAFKKKGIENFTDEDFFRWTAQDANFHALKPVFRAITKGFSRFDFSKVTEDILKGVYQELVDEDTRHALGEHYTPDWLCAYIVEKLQPRLGQKVLDPSCGSGSFLKATANYLVESYPEITASQLNDSLYGIDVHPLSVQIAKATLLITLGKKIQAEAQPLVLNVFLANTLLLPKKGIQGHLDGNYKLSIDNKAIQVDECIFSDRRQFYDIIFNCDVLAQADVPTGITRERMQISPTFMSRFKTRDENFLNGAYALYKAFSKAKIEGRDGIWAYIINNSYSPFFLREGFDFIVGNPPWLTFRDIENSTYQEEIERIAEQYRIDPPKQNLRTQLELAALFLAHCINYFMKKDGQLAFVMPRSFFSAGQHSNTREGQAEKVKITEAWDLKDVSPLFNVPACALFAQHSNNGTVASEEFLGRVYKGKLPNNNADKTIAQKKLSFEQGKMYLSRMNDLTAWSFGKKIRSGGVNPYRSLFKQGATIVPRRLFFVDITQEHDGNLQNRSLRVCSSKAVLREAKKPWKDIHLTGGMHSRFMFETALANNIVPFSLNGTHIVALPGIIKKNKIKLLAPDELMAETGEIESASWFSKVERIWEKRKTERNKTTNIIDYLNWMNKLGVQALNIRYIVLYTASGANAVSVVIDRKKALFQFPFINETIAYMYFSNNRKEAYYLCGFLNSAIPNKLIKLFQARGLQGERHIHTKILELPLPQFDKSNPEHIALAKLSERAAQKSSQYVASKNYDEHGGNMTSYELGRFRNEIREHIAKELKAIDNTVEKIVNRA